MSEKTVTIPRSRYQPSKTKLEENLRVDSNPEEIVKSLVQPIKIKRSDKPKKIQWLMPIFGT